MHSTPVSLLERLQNARDEDWERFVQLYSPLLYHWSFRLGFQSEDADDLVQDVLSLLLKELPRFQYSPQGRFRGWLWTVFLNRCRQNARRQIKAVNGYPLETDITVPDPVVEFDEREYREYLVHQIVTQLQDEFRPTTWKAFWASTVEDRPPGEIAQELGVSENAVYIAKSRVLRRLRQEMDGLLD